ncbi:DUF2339 domain-containing protein [Psychrobacter alimentarius]|uniref:DUF2339 domain-containing protein n=1 Tax=Psychrobacter TaxID=497 RepID=UPI0015CA4595|nr:DUF2339 domain-containing protein [Psychrobacter sp. JB193]
MMLYLLITQLGWLAFTALLIVVVALYSRISQQVKQLRRDVLKLQIALEQQKTRDTTSAHADLADKKNRDDGSVANNYIDNPFLNQQDLSVDSSAKPPTWPPSRPTIATTDLASSTSSADSLDSSPLVNDQSATTATAKNRELTSPIEPDERSLPMVTSLIHSIKNWFFGGNLVVRVGVLVLLVGVVLLLRLLSEYIEISIATKLMAIGVAGLGLAGLGYKLTAKRFSYGITLQGTGLAIAYLSTFFAYSVYQILPSIPSFIGLGVLSAVTIALAVRQNAFPLALLALSGGFFAPILTSEDTGSLVVLFSYYLLLNVTIAVIAHYRPWKILNLFGAGVTFGLAYYWGISENLTAVIQSQRWSLVLLVALHWLLYLFVVIRYAQQIISYNTSNESAFNSTHPTDEPTDTLKNSDKEQTTYLFPIDTGLLFSVPLLAFGLFAALLDDIPNALSMTSTIFAAVYFGLGWIFIKRSQRYALITEGMLALGFGFLALVVPLVLDAEWIAFGWSIQGLALVWFGRRSLRAWSVLFGLLLQLISIGMLVTTAVFTGKDYPVLALSISALSYLATVFILRASNSPTVFTVKSDNASEPASATISTYADSLGISTSAAHQWLRSIDSQSQVFKFVWHSPKVISFLTFTAVVWMLYVLMVDWDHWFDIWQSTTTLMALAALISVSAYWLIDRYQSWSEIRHLSRSLSWLFYAMLVLQLPQKFEQDLLWTTTQWLVFAILVAGWLIAGQLWLKTWHAAGDISRYSEASWLGTGILLIAAGAHYGLPDSDGVMALLIPAVLILAGLWFGYRSINNYSGNNRSDNNHKQDTQVNDVQPHGWLYWFDLQQALFNCAAVFTPIALLWVIITNWSYDGVIWNLPYFSLLNLYDVTSWLILLTGFSLYYLYQHRHADPLTASNTIAKRQQILTTENLLIILGLISFWLISSMLIRTLHAFIGTPLWDGAQGGAWNSEQVQTGLTILWTLLALVATIIASRYWQRALWFMGIGLLGIVVLKLVLVDLSQTEAIWRVISFLGAGSLILLIGYLAPLPPADKEQV